MFFVGLAGSAWAVTKVTAPAVPVKKVVPAPVKKTAPVPPVVKKVTPKPKPKPVPKPAAKPLPPKPISKPVLPVSKTVTPLIVPKSIPVQPPVSNTPAKPATFNIDIKNFQFSPSQLKIKKGDAVVFTNLDSMPHQVDSNPHPIHTDHTELNGPTITTGQTFSVTLNNVGTYNFHCHLHSSMQGTIIVE